MGASIATAADSHGRGVLHWSAASESGEQLLPTLIARGASLNMQDAEGYTPLHVYAITGRLYGLTALLHHGADPNIPNRYNHTPLHTALQHNRSETANMLLCYGAKLVVPPPPTDPGPIPTFEPSRPSSVTAGSPSTSKTLSGSKSIDKDEKNSNS
ncbi:ankyrin repeat domain-containing protein [archaeon]|nr:MAG: ankyrin repeat domain-containing protein [archaeon]